MWAHLSLEYRIFAGSAAPRGVTDHTAEVATVEVGILVSEYVCFHVSEGSFRLVFDAVVEGLQDILFEILCSRVRLNDFLPVGVREAGVIDSEHIHFNTGGYEGDDRMHVLRNAGRSVKCNRCPYVGDVLLRNPMTAQEVTRGICSIHFKAVCGAAVSRYQTDVVEHSAGVEKFGIELEATALACERAKVVDATGVIEQQTRFCVADEFRDFIGKFAVGNADARDKGCLESSGCYSHERPPG